jgi:hypothetical protein
VYKAQCAPNTVLISSFDQAVQLRLDNMGIAIPPWAAIAPEPDALWFVYISSDLSRMIFSYILKAKAHGAHTGTNTPLKLMQLCPLLYLPLSLRQQPQPQPRIQVPPPSQVAPLLASPLAASPSSPPLPHSASGGGADADAPFDPKLARLFPRAPRGRNLVSPVTAKR